MIKIDDDIRYYRFTLNQGAQLRSCASELVLEIHPRGFAQLSEVKGSGFGGEQELRPVQFDWSTGEFDDLVSAIRSAIRDYKREQKRKYNRRNR